MSRPGSPSREIGLVGYVRRHARVLTLLAVVIAAGAGASVARADGDPGSDVLVYQDLFAGSAAGLTVQQQAQLGDLLKAASAAHFPIRVAIIAGPADLGAVTALWRQPRAYARFLGIELSLAYKQRLLVVMPNGFGFDWPGHSTAAAYSRLARVPLTSRAGLATATAAAVQTLAAGAGIKLATSTHRTGAAGGPGALRPGNSGVRATPPGRAADSRVALSAVAGIGIVLMLLAVRSALRLRRARDPAASTIVDAARSSRFARRRALPAFVVLCTVAVGAPIAVIEAVRAPSSSASRDLAFNPHLDPGTRVSGQAADFTLSDQFGQPASLRSYRGKVVMLAFNDSECTTICPLTTTAMLDAKAMLGSAGSRRAAAGDRRQPESDLARERPLLFPAVRDAAFMALPDRIAGAAAAGVEGVFGRGGHSARADHSHAGAVCHRPPRPQGEGVCHPTVLLSRRSTRQAARAGGLEPAARPPPRALRHVLRAARRHYAKGSCHPAAHRRRHGGTRPRTLGAPVPVLRHLEPRDHQPRRPSRHPEPVRHQRRQSRTAPAHSRGRDQRRAIHERAAALPAHPPTPPLLPGGARPQRPSRRRLRGPRPTLVRPRLRNRADSLLPRGDNRRLAQPRRPDQHHARGARTSPEGHNRSRRRPDARRLPARAGCPARSGRQAPRHRIRARRTRPGTPRTSGGDQRVGLMVHPCRAEFGLFAAASAQFGRRVAFLGADTGDSPGDARSFLAQHPVSYPSYQASNPSALSGLVALQGLPTTIFLKSVGQTVFVHTGQYDSQETLNADIARAAQGG